MCQGAMPALPDLSRFRVSHADRVAASCCLSRGSAPALLLTLQLRASRDGRQGFADAALGF